MRTRCVPSTPSPGLFNNDNNNRDNRRLPKASPCLFVASFAMDDIAINFPASLSRYSKIVIANSGVSVLEVHKDLFPENYESIKADIERDIESSKKHRNQSGALEAAAQTIYKTMKIIYTP